MSITINDEVIEITLSVSFKKESELSNEDKAQIALGLKCWCEICGRFSKIDIRFMADGILGRDGKHRCVMCHAVNIWY